MDQPTRDNLSGVRETSGPSCFGTRRPQVQILSPRLEEVSTYGGSGEKAPITGARAGARTGNIPLNQFAATGVLSTPAVDAALATNSPVAVGVSGGKDSTVAAFETFAHLDRIGHTGPRLLIHADLGMVEWGDSEDICRRLADRLGTELAVVRRAKGGLMERWEQRWRDNVARYVDLLCVQLIMPWSAPGLRFCTSELKTAVICSDLTRRFPNSRILNVVGIRGEESNDRAKAPITDEQAHLRRVKLNTSGMNWHPIKHYTLADVMERHERYGFPLAPAYTVYGASRYSCVHCIFSTLADHQAAVRCEANHPTYRRMVELEAASTFAFQAGKWLGDVAPSLLDVPLRDRLSEAKERAKVRVVAEARIPDHLLYVKGWPTCVPTPAEADLLCSVRREVAAAVDLKAGYIDPAQLIGRYRELMRLKATRKPKRQQEGTRP
jgi:3'-phosphoadenosine 5'-phosphosulfate sulfotransferase (PAPS reductase)/FAD synthetase